MPKIGLTYFDNIKPKPGPIYNSDLILEKSLKTETFFGW